MKRIALWPMLGALGLSALAFLWANEWRWPDDPRYVFQTPDQVGAELFAQGNYLAASQHFQSPEWQAVACYRAADYPCALKIAASLTTAEAAFIMGNSYAQMHDPRRAEQAFERALALRPAWQAAQINRDLMRKALEQLRKDKAADEPIGGEPNEAPDGTVVDDRAKKGKRGEVHIEKLDADAIEKLWLRHVRTDPAAFLRLRFAREIELRENREAK